MRRQCIFCACRLALDPLPNQLTPFVSTPARRAYRTTPTAFQSATPASSSSSTLDNGTSVLGVQPNAASQQEKASSGRVQAQQQREAEAQQAKQEQIWPETEQRRTRHPSVGNSNASRTSTQSGRHQHNKEPRNDYLVRRLTPKDTGLTLGEAMRAKRKDASPSPGTFSVRASNTYQVRDDQRTETGKKGNRSERALNSMKQHAVKYESAESSPQNLAAPVRARHQHVTSQRDGNTRRGGNAASDRGVPKKVANPFAAPSKKDTTPTEQGTTSGWGIGATQTASEIAEEPVESPERRSIVWDDGVDRPPPPVDVEREVSERRVRHEFGDRDALPRRSGVSRTLRPASTATQAQDRQAANPNISDVLSHQPEPTPQPSIQDIAEVQSSPTQPYQVSAEVQSSNADTFGCFEDPSLEETMPNEQEAQLPQDGLLNVEQFLPAGELHSASSSTSPQVAEQSSQAPTQPPTPRDIDVSNDPGREVTSQPAPQTIITQHPPLQTTNAPPTSFTYGQDELRRLQQELDDGEITQKGYDKRRAMIVEMQQLQQDFNEGEITQKGFDKRRAAILAREGIMTPAHASTSSPRSQSQMPDAVQGSRGTQQRSDLPFGLSQSRAPMEEMVRPQEGGHNASRSQFSGTGYRATLFDRNETPQETNATDSSSTWQHFQPKSENSNETLQRQPQQQTQQLPQQQSQQRPREEISTDADVDRKFEAHRQTRPQHRHVEPPSTENRSYDLFSGRPQWQTRTCGRCGETGHIARDCPDPYRNTTCHKCGQKGHLAARCPNHDVPAIRDAAPRRNNFERVGSRHEQAAADERYAAKSADPFGAPIRFTPAVPRESQDKSRFTPAGTREGQDGFGPSRERSSFSPTRPDVDDEEESRRASKASRRAQKWAGVDDEPGVDNYADRRKGRRSSRREFDEDDDDDEGARDVYRARKAKRQAEEEAETRKKERAAREKRQALKAQQATKITLPEYVNVQQLSQLLGVRYEEFVERLEELGYDDVFPGKTLNAETSGMIAMEYNFEPNYDVGAREEEERDLKPRPEVEDKEFLPTRPPVVTIMGHVDHGKTTILDYLRKSSVAAGEAGGITQHIGAFSVPMSSSGKTVTFLDTPGHAAFLAMRQRGATVTDIVVLVVAADDSVKPQTLEAIKHAKTAGVPMIVAINKVDKEEADIQRCKQDLARHGVEIEDFGGDTQVVCVSGKTGKGMDDLEENIVTLSEILDHRAETDGGVEGWVLEATTKKAGRVATVLVRRGTLRPGSVIVAGRTWARVRTLRNEGGQALHEVSPGMPVEVDGWKDQPVAGDEVLQAPNEQKATSVVEYRLECDERERAAKDMEAINEARRIQQEKHEKEKATEQVIRRAAVAARAEGLDREAVSSAEAAEEEQQQSGQMLVPFIIKADVSGSAEAVSAYIMSVSNPLIAPQILQSHVGAVHESDIELAYAASGHIIAFNLPTDPEMQALAESKGVKVLSNNIIYRVLDDVKELLEGMLPPVVTQRVLGEAEISASFEIGVGGGRKKVKIAGCKVRNGVLGVRGKTRVMRGGGKVYDGTISSLKNVKKDVQEMRKGAECGVGFEGWEGFEVGDQVQVYEEVRERRKL